MLAFHQMREAIAMGILRFIHINGKENPGDVLTKPLDHGVLYPLCWTDELQTRRRATSE
jgi:hypothetical protein